MQIAKLPCSISDEVDRKARCFLWEGTKNRHGVYWSLATSSPNVKKLEVGMGMG